MTPSRRSFCASLLGAATLQAFTRPAGTIIDAHIHLFDPKRFPYHKNAAYRPEPVTLDEYKAFVQATKINGTIIVHPEPYQDDHSYLEYCFANEPRPGFFKGTCLFDPISLETPSRMSDLLKRNKGRIVALRVHSNRPLSEPPTTSGPIRDRDLKHPQMKKTWRAAHDLGLAIQVHMNSWHAPEVMALASEFRDTTVIIDHFGRAGQGTPEQYDGVLKMAKLPRVIMKFSAVNYSSKEPAPHRDAASMVKRTYDAFGPDRIIWGGLGHTPADFEKHVQTFETLLAFVSETDKAKIRGGNAVKLFRWTVS